MIRRSGAQVAEDDRREAIARPIAVLYRERTSEQYHVRGAQSFMPLIAEILKRGCSAHIAPKSTMPLTACQQWIVEVTWAMAGIGFIESKILVERLTRGQKTEGASWGRIAHDVNDALPDVVIARFGRVLDADAAARLYYDALRTFVTALDERSIRPQLGGSYCRT
jgi:hypothetical protein